MAGMISAGDRLAVLTAFPRWPHLHIGVFDTHNNYALMHAPDSFEIEPAGSTGESLLIVDDESPVIRQGSK